MGMKRQINGGRLPGVSLGSRTKPAATDERRVSAFDLAAPMLITQSQSVSREAVHS